MALALLSCLWHFIKNTIFSARLDVHGHLMQQKVWRTAENCTCQFWSRARAKVTPERSGLVCVTWPNRRSKPCSPVCLLPTVPCDLRQDGLLAALLCIFLQHLPRHLLSLSLVQLLVSVTTVILLLLFFPLHNAIKENTAIVTSSGSDIASRQICLCHPGSSLATAWDFCGCDVSL